MSAVVFAYGTLKEGFANFHVNEGRRVPGAFVTVERFPLFVVSEWWIPWLVDRAGEGEPVAGELYEVGDAALARMDRLEQLNEPGWYTRREILVRSHDAEDAPRRRALVYFGDAARLATWTVHAGPVAEFTAAHDAMYRRRDEG